MKKSALLLLPLLATLLQPAYAQRGCTDSRATNFNPGAVVNDGSCQYAVTTTPLITKAELAADVAETSGLQYTSQALWTLNDSGNPPVLFRLDPSTGTVNQRVLVDNFSNLDWEDLTADAQYLYVGDFGNNSGNRQDLRVLRIRKADIGTGATATVAAQAILFSYPDQTDFNPGVNNHNFDCEALLYFNDSLHLFTKNWADRRTKYYTIPAAPGTHVARLKASFNVNGLVTAASLNAAGTEAGLLGYNPNTGATFLWLLYDFAGTNFLQGNKRRIELPNALQIGQAEGVSFIDRYRMYLSNERLASIVTVPQRLYELDASPWLAAPLPTTAARQAASFRVFPNPASQRFTVQRAGQFAGKAEISVQDLRGKSVFFTALEAERIEQQVQLASVPAGVYILKIKSGEGVFTRKIVLQ